MVSVSEENVSGIDTHFRRYRIGGIDTFGIVSPITSVEIIAFWCACANYNNIFVIHSKQACGGTVV